MKEMVERILQGYGTALTLEHQEETLTFRGFLQAVHSKGKQNMESFIEELGEYPQGSHVFIGPPDLPAAQGDVLRQGSRRFLLRRAEPFYVAEEQMYCWGICTEEGQPWTE